MGALLRIAHVYRSYGGGAPVTALALVQSSDYRALWDARRLNPAPQGPHRTGSRVGAVGEAHLPARAFLVGLGASDRHHQALVPLDDVTHI